MRHPIEYIRRRLASKSKVNPKTGCREWQGVKRGGYGRLWDGERLVDAHRLAWECAHGPIPPGVDILHRCDNPSCIKVSDLFPGDQGSNNADRHAKGRTRNGAAKLRGRPSKTRGARHVLAQLGEEQARRIKFASRTRGSREALAKRYKVSVSLIDGIRSGRNWGWL